MKRLLRRAYPIRFQLFFVSLLGILFGSLFMPRELFEHYFLYAFLLLNILAGTTLFLYANRFVLNSTILLLLIVVLSVLKSFVGESFIVYFHFRFFLFAIYYSFVSFELVKQVWKAHDVSTNIILGMMSGYISLGLVAYFGFMAIETLYPGSYHGIPADMGEAEKSQQLMNFSYITLLTVGYGDISPVSFVAQKLAVLTAMVGQFYLVIITAVVIGKFLQK